MSPDAMGGEVGRLQPGSGGAGAPHHRSCGAQGAGGQGRGGGVAGQAFLPYGMASGVPKGLLRDG